ncbi:MAG: glycosyltransferase [Gemmatimonadales bacterium]|jgi:hypothetical protein|nr:MAG: glycosyltransferase [Gemmatimonadales bacterium]
MKLKELPRSIYSAWRLRRTPVTELGASATPLPGRVVVSMTSVRSRFPYVHLAVRSLLDQSVRPERIVLWLGDSLREHVPGALEALLGERFEIRHRLDTGPHMKLVYALQEFPEHTVVTADDDHLYARSWLERLWKSHEAHPDEVIGHECRRISYGTAGNVLPYIRWASERAGESHAATVALGYAGVLYPPGVLFRDVTDQSLYRDLAPQADDLWFKAMSSLFGTRTRRSGDPPRKPVPIRGSQAEALGRANITEDRNREQWERISRHYGVRLKE